MINIVVWTHDLVEIERQEYSLIGQDDMVKFLKDLLDKVHYSGETICLEKGTVLPGRGKSVYEEIDRWK